MAFKVSQRQFGCKIVAGIDAGGIGFYVVVAVDPEIIRFIGRCSIVIPVSEEKELRVEIDVVSGIRS